MEGHIHMGLLVVAHIINHLKALQHLVGYQELAPVHIMLATHLSSLYAVAASPSQAIQKQIQKKS